MQLTGAMGTTTERYDQPGLRDWMIGLKMASVAMGGSFEQAESLVPERWQRYYDKGFTPEQALRHCLGRVN